MIRRLKKGVSLLLALLMTVTAMPYTALAEDETVDNAVSVDRVSFAVSEEGTGSPLAGAVIDYELWAYESDIGVHIEAEDYDMQSGINDLKDADGNRIGIGSFAADGWAVYSINVPSSAYYKLVANASGMLTGGSVLELRDENDENLAECAVAGVSGAGFSVAEGSVVWLEAGEQTLKMCISDTECTLGWFELVFASEEEWPETSTETVPETVFGSGDDGAETETAGENLPEDSTEAGTGAAEESSGEDTGEVETTENISTEDYGNDEPENVSGAGTEADVQDETAVESTPAEETIDSGEASLEDMEEGVQESVREDSGEPAALSLDTEDDETTKYNETTEHNESTGESEYGEENTPVGDNEFSEGNESGMIILAEGSITADSNGEAVISGLSEYESRISADKIHISYTVGSKYYASETGEKSGIVFGEIISAALKKLTVELEIAAFDGGTITICDADDNIIFSRSYPDEEGKTTENAETVSIEAGTILSLSVKADEKHEIFSVYINGAQYAADSRTEFTVNNLVAETDISITAEFIRIYRATAVISSESKGTGNSVKINDSDIEDIGGVAAVRSGDTITVIASPKKGYRVSQAVVYTVSDDGSAKTEIAGQSGTVNDYEYRDTRTADNNYEYVVTFSENVYHVTASIADNFEESQGGTVTVNAREVLYGGNSTVTIVPDDGFNIDSILINAVDNKTEGAAGIQTVLSEADIVREGESASFELTDISGDKDIVVKFTKIQSINNEDEAVYSDNLNSFVRMIQGGGCDTYVFKKDAAVRFKISDGIDGSICINDKINPENTGLFEITEDTLVEDIRVYYHKDGESFAKWYAISLDKPVSILFDGGVPAAYITAQTEPNINNYYSGDINFSIAVSDTVNSADEEADICSGIKSVEYYVECRNGEKTVITQGKGSGDSDEGILYSFLPGENGTDDSELLSSWNGIIGVDAEKNNSEEVTVCVIVTDNAGNGKTYRSASFGVNTVAPTVSVSMDGILADEADDGYYNTARTATVVFNDRDDTFDEEAAVNSILADSEGITAGMVSFNKEDAAGEHTAVITFDQNGSYTFGIGTYTNKAGLSNRDVSYSGGATDGFNITFTIDINENPGGRITIGNSFWEELLETITFGYWSSESVTVKIEAEDDYSGIKSVEYYVSESRSALDSTVLDKLYKDGEFINYNDEFEIYKDESGMPDSAGLVVYARILDKAGNVAYISSDGIIVDLEETGVPTAKITARTEPNENNYYNAYNYYDEEDTGKIIFDVEANDPEVNSSYSGIKTVEYYVECKNGEETVITQGKGSGDVDEGALYNFSYKEDGPAYSDLICGWDGTVGVDVSENNGEAVTVYVIVTDNAGNSATYQSDTFGINTVSPEIKVTSERTECAGWHVDGYYTGTVTATVNISDRDDTFDENGISLWFEAADSSGVPCVDENGNPLEPEISGWSRSEDESGVYTATVKFAENANYKWSVSYTNRAEMSGKADSDNDERHIFEFTLDNDDPEGSISIKDNVWSKLLDILTFGLFGKESVEVGISALDVTSPLDIKYFVSSKTEAYTYDELEDIADEVLEDDGDDASAVSGEDSSVEEPCWLSDIDFNSGNKLTVSPDMIFTVYAKITDYAGNYIYISSDGYIVDAEKPDITISKAVEKDVYGLDFADGIELNVSVTDSKPSSGIKTVEYWVESTVNGKTVITQGKDSGDMDNGMLYEFNKDKPFYSDLMESWSGSIIVYPEKNNSCDVTVYVKVCDNAGNESYKSVNLDIDITSPVINISFDNNDVNKIADNRGYFGTNRTATVTVIERTAHFDTAVATKGISITAVDAEGKTADIKTESMISGWVTEEGATPDEAVHTATIRFTEDANYTFGISYTDKAGNKNGPVDYGSSVTPDKFTVDKIAPTGTVKAEAINEWAEEWSGYDAEHALDLTFGLWTNNRIIVTGTASDRTSPIEQVEYLKKADTVSMTRQQLDNSSGWADFNGIEIFPNEQAVVYLRITDYAGNISYIRTDGLIADSTKPAVEKNAPMITVNPEQPVNGIYNRNVKVDIAVDDPVAGITYSGLKTITYEILNMGTVTQRGVLYSMGSQSPKQDDLLRSWSGSITVDAGLNNSNDVVIRVYAEDNAQNSTVTSTSIKIDITAPSINITYNNNSPYSGKYYKENRVAAVSVTERNFRAEDVKIIIKSAHGSSATVSGWSEYSGSGNLDNTVHTAYITYSIDDDYTFEISYADMAGNICPGETYAAGTANPKEFTIDKTVPLVSVSYDNDSARNSNYYNAERTAFITIREHNFDASGVTVDITADNDGSPVSIPAVSSWSSNGDTHTASVRYMNDALYTFDISYTDMAGNAAAEFMSQSFYVDTTKPAVTITDIVDESANPEAGNIGFTITAVDTNFDVFTPVLTAVVYENGQFVRKTIDAGSYKDIKNGKVFTVENLSTDGIYYITCTVVDKAGNAYNEITLYDADKNSYTEKRSGNDTLLTFSVNRKGSVYEPDTFTSDINGRYIYDVYDNIILVEINADPLLSYQVSSNGKVLEEGKDYTVAKERGEGAWYKYTYIIDKTLFAEEGEYNIVVASVDKAESSGYSDVKGAGVKFTVDKTAPTVTVSGLADNGRYQVEKQKVTVIPADDGGRLQSLLAELLDRDGNVMETLISLSGEELEEALNENGGRLTFDIGDGMYQQVHIMCSDCAENDKGATNTYDYTYKNITVSSNAFAIFWANAALRYGVFIGLAAAAVLLLVIIFIIKRKR